MPTISIINYKGGVGKTTLTANIAAELAQRGMKVLAIDLDAQASLTFSFVQPDYWSSKLQHDKTIKQWFDAFGEDSSAPIDLESLILKPTAVNARLPKNGGVLHFIASHLGLINVDLELATELNASNLAQAKRKYLKVHRRLIEGLARPAFADYDVILIDCPPNFNIVTKTAIIASDQILVPSKADYLSTLGTDYLVGSLRQLVREHNEYLDQENADLAIDPAILGVIFTMVQFYGEQPISAQRPFIAQTEKLGLYVFDSYFRDTKTKLANAAADNVPLILDGYASTEEVIDELRRLVDEVVTRAGL
ncbi:ParA family protein [Rhodococcus sovatensis]|jgi:chromosome partitioning protein|uniref:AAA family ATPase n=1 Tax=Rhodococcus sovatensis TaxID=1805840 RepID=A0ABZ2PKL5_9NOCA